MPVKQIKPADVYVGISYKELVALISEATEVPDRAVLEIRQVNPPVGETGTDVTSGAGPKMRITPGNLLQVRLVDPKLDNNAAIMREQRDLISKLRTQDLGDRGKLVSLKGTDGNTDPNPNNKSGD